MSDITNKIRKDMFTATKEGKDEIRDITRMVLAAIKNEEISAGEDLKDEKIVEIIRREVKKLNEAVTEFESADRGDLAEVNKKQVAYLDEYLPKLMEKDEVTEVVSGVVEKVGATGMSDMGKVMGAAMGELKGKADGALVKDVVQEVLSKI